MLLSFPNLLTKADRRIHYMNPPSSALSVFLPLGFKSSSIFLFNLRRARALFRKTKRKLKVEQVTNYTMTFFFLNEIEVHQFKGMGKERNMDVLMDDRTTVSYQ